MKLASKQLIELLHIIATGLKRLGEILTQGKRQAERDELENDPANWMRNHFGGVRNKSADANKTDAKRNRDG